LLKRFPKLSAAEIKLCVFLKLGMKTKDVASVLYQNPDSVKVARSGLRKKKLGLIKEDNLQTFLLKF